MPLYFTVRDDTLVNIFVYRAFFVSIIISRKKERGRGERWETIRIEVSVWRTVIIVRKCVKMCVLYCLSYSHLERWLLWSYYAEI